MRRLLSLTLALLLGAPGSAAADDEARPRAAVLVLRAGEASTTLADNLTEILIAAISQLDRFEIVGKEEFQAILGVQSEKRALSCLHDTTCLSKVGLELGIREVIVGNVSTRGETHTLILDRVDVRKGAVIRHLFHEEPSGADALTQAVFDLAEQLFAEAEPEAVPVVPPPMASGDPEPPPVAPAEPGAPTNTGAVLLWSSLGVGVVAGAVGAVMGIRVRNAAANVTAECCVDDAGPRAVYKMTRQEALEVQADVDSWSTTANLLYGVSGLALAAAGTIWWLGLNEAEDGGGEAASPTLVPMPVAGGMGAGTYVTF